MEFPITGYRHEIMGCDSPYVIIVAETGSGKSTQVPLWFLEEGKSVLVTEPLIETVIGTSEYVAELAGCQIGDVIGYRTGKDRKDSDETRVLYCTDGLALVRELSGHNRFDVLVIDELHQWNVNQSTLEAWAWKGICDGSSPFEKIIVLSATIDAEKLSQERGDAPVFNVPGKIFPIQVLEKGNLLTEDVKSQVSIGRDCLVFMPGKREIEETISSLNGIDAELIPFHGEVERSEKNKAYRNYDRPKVVVSTNALETGRTLLPSTGRELCVIDSGMERRIELIDGIEGLYLKPISKAQSLQRKGRTGRVGNGYYIDHCPNGETRPDFPKAEILRTRLDLTVLRLAVAGYDATDLPFFHTLNVEEIKRAKHNLLSLGAITETGSVTAIGKKMVRLPISVEYSRMVIESALRGVTGDVVTIAAILENKSGIGDKTGRWKSLISDKTKASESDILAELELYEIARKIKYSELRDKGIFAPAYKRVQENRSRISEALKGLGLNPHKSSGDKNEVLKSVISGMITHVWQLEYGSYRNGDNSIERQIDNKSLCRSCNDLLVGVARDFEIPTRRGSITKHIIGMCTPVDNAILLEVAPQLYKKTKGLFPQYNPYYQRVYSYQEETFLGREVKSEMVEDTNHPEASNLFGKWISRQINQA